MDVIVFVCGLRAEIGRFVEDELKKEPSFSGAKGRHVKPKKKKTISEELIQEIVRRIVAAVQPEKIILFGSAARGEMGPDSDLDLLVIKPCEHRRRTARKIERA